jgi:hypothetical protein
VKDTYIILTDVVICERAFSSLASAKLYAEKWIVDSVLAHKSGVRIFRIHSDYGVAAVSRYVPPNKINWDDFETE